MNIYTIIITMLILSVLVVVHELGHFLAAKKTGVLVEEFAIGMGPKLYGRQGKETLFTIRAFPVGGFCKMRGEEPKQDEEGKIIPRDPDDVPDERSYEAKTQWQKLLILVAGSGMNIIFAWVCLFVVSLLMGKLNFIEAIGNAFLNTWRFAGLIFQSFGMLFTGQVGLDNLAGPIGMVSMVGSFMDQGVVIVVAFTAMLSVNLGIINMFPIPALDGGRVFVVLIELISRRKFSPDLENKINYFGFIALILLALIIAVNDIMRLAF